MQAQEKDGINGSVPLPKVAGIANDMPELEVDHEEGADLLVLGWGSSYGPIRAAVRRARLELGLKVASAHLFHLNPFPPNLGDVLRSYDKVLVPETNTGQLVKMIRAEYLVDADSFTKVEGLTLFMEEIVQEIQARA